MKSAKLGAAAFLIGALSACGGGDPIIGDWRSGSVDMSIFDNYDGALFVNHDVVSLHVEPKIQGRTYTIQFGTDRMFCDYGGATDELDCLMKDGEGVANAVFNRR